MLTIGTTNYEHSYPPQSLLKIISNFFQISIDKTLSPIYNKSVLKDEKSTKQVSTSNRTLNLPLNMFEYQTFSCLIVFSSNLHKTFNISQEKERTVILSFLLYMGAKSEKNPIIGQTADLSTFPL